jgi:transcription elongation factor Elf1
MPADQSSLHEADTRTKTTLFCPNCGHKSPITGDWTVRTVETCQILECPACETTITSRLREAAPAIPCD